MYEFANSVVVKMCEINNIITVSCYGYQTYGQYCGHCHTHRPGWHLPTYLLVFITNPTGREMQLRGNSSERMVYITVGIRNVSSNK